MATKIQISKDKSIEVSSILTGTEKGFSVDHEYNNVFLVTVTSGTVQESFEYHISIYETKKGKKVLTDEDHINALYCFIGDAISGQESFEDFCSDMGFDEDSRKAEKIWKLCQESTTKAGNLNLGDLYQVSNFLQEKYSEVL